MSRQFAAKRASALNVDRLVDGLVRHLHFDLSGKLLSELNCDLLRTQLQQQFGPHHPAQLELGTQLGRLRPASLGIGPYLGHAGPVGPRPASLPAPGPGLESAPAPVQLVPHVSTQLAQDRRRSSAQTLGDETYR